MAKKKKMGVVQFLLMVLRPSPDSSIVAMATAMITARAVPTKNRN
jgi:hypothetical protein